MLRIGVISDTHNMLRPEAVQYLRGSDHIIHAGDICEPSVLDQLREIAPLTVVRGNNDRGEWAESIPETELAEIGGVYFYIVHDVAHALRPQRHSWRVRIRLPQATAHEANLCRLPRSSEFTGARGSRHREHG